MAYPSPIRSMNHDLEEGMTDGKYKKLAPNRGGCAEYQLRERTLKDLNDTWYGVHECQDKANPDSTHGSTPDFVDTGNSECRCV